MENKQTFGAFILRRRKELGMTQKEFAELLYVTDSAVSKWERGLAYPDITLLQNICSVLQISEKELLSASEDTEGRRIETLAKKYLLLMRNRRITQLFLYGAAALICLICNLAIQHTLSWFWIVLSAELVAASLTLLPIYVPEQTRGLWRTIGFTGSLLLLLAICCLYTQGDWFFIAAASVLFGLGCLVLPAHLHHLPAPWNQRKLTVYLCTQTVLLLVLYLSCWLRSGGDWLLSTCLWTIFGLSTAFLPLVLRQLPLGSLSRHKALIWLSADTFLLFLGLIWESRQHGTPFRDLLVAGTCLTLPWGLLGCIRYLPINRWFRASASCVWITLWCLLSPSCMSLLLKEDGLLFFRPLEFIHSVDFTRWSDPRVLHSNICALILMTLLITAIVFVIIGVRKQKQK